MVLTSFNDISVTIGNHRILSAIDLPRLEPGQLLGLIGPNAAGKSTLLKALNLEVRSSGCLEVDDRSLRNMNALDRRSAIAYMPQTIPQGSALTPYELVRSFAKATGLDLRLEELDCKIALLFDNLGLVNEAHKPMQTLSGGKRQLVGLCLAMIHDPKVLLLDEPTSGLDLHWQLAAISVVRAYLQAGNRACIIALHDINLALRFCDLIAVLKDGQQVAAGIPEDVIQPGLI
ncbi:MAG: ABC transporter ATP-binding protein, partial [Pseudomonadota bacterium]